MKYRSLLSFLLVAVMLVSIATCGFVSVSAGNTALSNTSDAGASVDEIVNPYSAAAKELDRNYAYDGDDLGCTYTPEQTTFKLWAPTSTKASVNLFATGTDSEEGAAELGKYEMTFDEETGCYSVTIKGDLKNVYYTYTVTNKTLVTKIEKTVTAVDPYAKAVGANGLRAMVVDLDSTDPEGWEDDAHIYVDQQTDAIIWEVVVRDFSQSESSGVSEANRGKYLAFTEKGTTVNGEGEVATCVDYLKELGVTHVQINPFFDFTTVNETEDLSTQYNWGYDPENYNVPEGSYSSNPYDGNVRINECKQMIQALHDAGIGVIMDVVYNHTYKNSTSNFNLLVPDYYYRMNQYGGFSGASGCGNDTASERAMFRKFMIESCRYWAEEYHVDGFRFDLMGVHDTETMNLIRADLDEIDPRILMYGEGWSAASSVFDKTTCTGAETISASQFNAQYLDERIALFNDEIRDGVKGQVFTETGTGFAQGSKAYYSNIAYGTRANTVGKGSTWSAKAPSQCVTYTSCHDNHTLYDRLATSVYGGSVNHRQRYTNLIEMNKLAAGIINTSQGISFMLAGEEMARSKDGDENSYKSSPKLNMIDWNNLLTNADLVSYYKGLFDIRKVFSPFNEGTTKYSTSYTMNNSLVGMHDHLAYTVKNDTEGEWKTVAVIHNSNAKTANTITLKDESVDEWVVIADDSTAGLDAIRVVKGNTFTVAPSSTLIAVDKESYEACGFASGDSKVVINHKNAKTGEILTTQVITGEVGSGYITSVDDSLSLRFDFREVVGNAKGVITEGVTTVDYLYDPYVAPSLAQGDVTGDGKVTIADGTAIQKYIAQIIDFDAEQLKTADYDYSSRVNVKDVTLLQKHLADFEVSIGTITVNYSYVKEDGSVIAVAPTITKEYRVGTEYTTKAASVDVYKVSTDLPKNASGIVPPGETVVDYYYEYSATGVKVHAAHIDERQTWVPNLWAWSASGSNAFSSWPGAAMLDEGNGWFFIDAALPQGSYSVIISQNGSPQTMDYTGIEAPEIWIIINDDKVVNKGDFITIYTEDPDLDAVRAQYNSTLPTEEEIIE